MRTTPAGWHDNSLRKPDGAAFGYETLPVGPLLAGGLLLLSVQTMGSRTALLAVMLFGVVGFVRWRGLARLAGRGWAFLALPVLGLLSAAWSPVPDVTLRYGVQFLLTVLFGLLLAGSLPLNRFPQIVFAAAAGAGLLGLASGRTGVSESGVVLIGFTGSKNQLAYLALFWLVAALTVCVDRSRHPLLRLLATASAPIAIFAIVQAQAMTALVSALAATAMLALLGLAALLPRGGRLFSLGIAVSLLLGAVAAWPQIEEVATRIRSDVLQKDARLTGRTLLWEAADELAADAPIIGHGYRATWMGPEGRGLLLRNHQTDGRAFHFHDTVREVRVDLGAAGLALWLLPLTVAFGRLTVLLVQRVTPARTFVGVTLALLSMRMRTDLILAPLLLDTVLLYACMAYLWWEPAHVETGTRSAHQRRRHTRPAPIRLQGDAI